MEGSAALFITSWKRNSYGPANWKLITDFCENTLKKKPVEFSKIHCTVLDVDVGDEVKEDAARHSVTLIPATRPKLSDPIEDPPAINWIRFPDSYYPELGKLENINHVVALSSNVKKTAAALQESVFPGAEFHPPPNQPSAAVFINEAWNKDALGLTGFHRTLVQDFCERKAKAGETLKAFSTVLDVKISDDQKQDADNCGVTLIPAQRKDKADHRDDPQKLEWLLNHEIYYPDLREVENVKYVIGYAPKTGRAAADIRRKLFPGAKLVLINHARPEANCLQAEEHGLSEFEEKMLQMASEADILFSIGPYIHDYFENAYRAEVQGRDLSGIPHEEILPRPDTCFWVKKPKEKPVAQHHILSCGQMDTQNAIERCKSIAASIGTVANRRKEHYSSHPEWKIQGVSKKAGKTEQKILADASESPYVYPKLKPGHSIKSLLTSLQQSHLCLPSPCYWDYSLYGLEAMTFGLPTSVHDDSRLAHFVMKHLKMCADYCVIRDCEVNLSKKILEHLEKTSDSFKKANALKTALTECEAITESFAKFASLLQEPIKKVHEGNCKGQEVATCADVRPSSDCEVSTQSTKQVPESINGKISTLAVTRDGSIGRQAIEETRGDVIDNEDTEYGQTTITPSEMENENSNTEEAMVRNRNDEQQDILVKVALDEERLYKRLRELEEQAKDLSLQLRRSQETKKTEVKAAWGECEHGMKRRVQAVLADEDSCNEVKKVWTERVGLDPTTVTAESLGILLKILTLYYLYRLKQTCRYRNLAKALEPLLITDEMREIAVKHGITLQLKATYDTLKFEEIEHFFINRDGGGVQPLTFHDEIEDDGHCNTDPMGEEPPLSQQASDKVVVTASDKVVVTASDQIVVTASDKVVVTASDQIVVTASGQVVVTASDQVAEQISQTKLEQEFEENPVAPHGELTQPITAAQESQARSLLPIKPSEQQLTDSDIRYLALAESCKVQSLQSHLDKSESKVQSLQSQLDISESNVQSLQSQLQKASTEKEILETQLADALQEKSQLEKQFQEYKQRYHSAENVALTAKLKKFDPKNIEDLQTQLKEQNTVITELKAKLSKLSDAQSDIEPQMKTEESLQLGEQIITSEIVHEEMTEPSADNEIEEEERPKSDMTVRYGSEMETATPTQPEMTGRYGSEMETATPTQPEMTGRDRSEMETATPTQPEMTGRYGSEMETVTQTQPEMTGREESEIKAATPTQPEMTGRYGSEMETVTPTQPEMTGREGSEMETATSTQPEMTAGDGRQVRTAMVTTATKLKKEKKKTGGIISRMVKLFSGGSDEMGSSDVMSKSKKQQHGSGTAGSEESPSGPVSSEKKSSGPVSSEKKASGPVSPGSKMEQRSSVTAGSGSKELSRGPASSVVAGGTVIPGAKEGQSGTDGDSGEEASDTESKKAIFGGPATSVAGGWSRRSLKGHQGHRFKNVNGLAFHKDKLLVCDSDNNIVHILNQHYTCEKELGSFSGQFAKPFKPWSIAVSGDNLYFILDDSNVQIVVCDQNNKVIRIINLPAGSDPRCIALVKGFVIVTEVNAHRVLKYSLDGMYIGEFGRRGVNHTEFRNPYFVAVNSKDVIMVSDCWNDCIKCFDAQFNYLYKYSKYVTDNAQVSYPYSIAVDGADNIYVCDYYNARILIRSKDGMGKHHLFQREVRHPEYMAVTADGDRIAVVSGWFQSRDEIVVFSK